MIIDYREKELIALLPNEQIKNLPVADIWISVTENELPSEGGILIERKTIADFEASFLDGRYREQRTRLLAFAHEHKASPMYILEGNINSTRRTEPSTLKQLLNRLQLRYKIPVMVTNSVGSTAELCQLLQKQLETDPKCFIYEEVAYDQTIHVKKKDNQSDSKYLYLSMIQQVSGISGTIASKLQEVYPKFSDLWLVTEADLAEVKIGLRKLGPKVASKLYNALHG